VKKTAKAPSKKKAASSAKQPKAPSRAKAGPTGPSTYALELSIDPGGGRRGDVFVYNRLEHVRRVLEQEFMAENRGLAAYLSIWYGERILLWVMQRGRVVEAIDLQPMIRVHGLGLEGVPLADKAKLAPLRRDDHLGEAVMSDEKDVRFEIDWDRLAADVPALEGDLLRPGQSTLVKGGAATIRALRSYLSVCDELHYGYNDLEAGEEPAPHWEDPDPSSREEDGE
jgi:hypothetical protein